MKIEREGFPWLFRSCVITPVRQADENGLSQIQTTTCHLCAQSAASVECNCFGERPARAENFADEAGLEVVSYVL